MAPQVNEDPAAFFGYEKPRPSSAPPPQVNEGQAGRPPNAQKAPWQGPVRVNPGWHQVFGRWPQDTDPIAPRPVVDSMGKNYNPFSGRWS